MTRLHTAWTGWVAISIVAAVACDLVLGLAFWARPEALLLAFAAGGYWFSIAPRVLRWIGRRVG